jgi:hypothetical protein
MNNLGVVTLIAVILFFAALIGIVLFWWTAPVPTVKVEGDSSGPPAATTTI